MPKVKSKKLKNKTGFSLIELMVSVGILTMVNIMIFASYPQFSQKMSLRKTSNEVALIIRQAQAYAMGIKRVEISALSETFPGYGVHFEKNDKRVILFADISADESGKGNDVFDTSGVCANDEECVDEYEISTGDFVSSLSVCDSSGGCAEADTIDIVNPRAAIVTNISSSGIICNSCSYAKITLQSPRSGEDNKKYIKVWRSGQITVE